MNFLNRSANQPQRPTVVIKIRNATNFDVVIYMNAILCFLSVDYSWNRYQLLGEP